MSHRQPLCGRDQKTGISLLKYRGLYLRDKDTTSPRIPPREKVNGEQWRQLERARTELMRGNKIHSSLQFQGWRNWDLRKGPESGRRREILNERHYGRRKPHYTRALPAGACGEKTQSMFWLCPAGVNLLSELRFPHPASLLLPPYAKTLLRRLWEQFTGVLRIYTVNQKGFKIYHSKWVLIVWCHGCLYRVRIRGGQVESLFRCTQGFSEKLIYVFHTSQPIQRKWIVNTWPHNIAGQMV